jgi:hypothetical protein
MAIENLDAIQALTERAKRRLAHLTQDLEEEELPPTAGAQLACLDLLAAAATAIAPPHTFPFPHLNTAGEGDLSCEWRGGNRVVVAAISPEGQVSLYRYEMCNGRAMEREALPRPTAEALGRTMAWLRTEEISSP